MGQVPTKYLIIGNGRVARHFCYYFDSLKLPFTQWSRTQSKVDLVSKVNHCDRIVVLIKDDAIERFIVENDFVQTKPVVHFSGLLQTKYAAAAHPLMSFGTELLPREDYKKIPFFTEKNGLEFAELLPGLPNPHFQIPPEDRNFYHSLCVLSGNFTVILWQKFFSELESRWQIPASAAHLYLQKICDQLLKNAEGALTGPIVRGDHGTITKNISALEDKSDPFMGVYLAFVEAYRQMPKKGINYV